MCLDGYLMSDKWDDIFALLDATAVSAPELKTAVADALRDAELKTPSSSIGLSSADWDELGLKVKQWPARALLKRALRTASAQDAAKR